MATLRNAILAAREALTSVTAVTDLVPATQITFGNSPQKQTNPRIVIEVPNSEYAPTLLASRKVQTHTIEYAVYSDSVDQCTAIMDEVRLALDAYVSSDYAVRVTDESFQAEVDNVLLGVVVATFQDAAGAPGFDPTLAGQLSDTQAALAAETAAWEAATGGTYEEYVNPPAYNATGEVGETATAIWGFQHIADGYTGPVCQMFDVNTHDGVSGVDGYDTVDVYPNTLHLYVVQNHDDDATTALTDSKEWRVKKVYDQIGSNDMYFDVQDAFDTTGSWPTIGPKLQFLNGAYALVRSTYPFRTTTPTNGEDFMVVYDCTTTNRRETILSAGGTNDGAAYRNWAIVTWDDYTTATRFYYGTGAEGGQYGSLGGASTITSVPAILNNSGGRQCFVASRKGGEAWLWDGTNGHTDGDNASYAPDPSYTAYFGISIDTYNPASDSIDGFYSLALHEGGHVADEALLEEYANALESATGFSSQREAYNQANS